jgi:hypothetical protein
MIIDMLAPLFIGYFVIMVLVFCFLSFAGLHIGVYWYQWRIETLRLWIMTIFWPFAPIMIFLHEREIRKYLSLSFEERMKIDGRYAVRHEDPRGVWIGYALPDKDGMINTMNGPKHYTEWKHNSEIH